MSRRKSREIALQILFQLDFNVMEPEKATAYVLQQKKVSDDDVSYIHTLVNGTMAYLEKIDQIILTLSKEWRVERMPGVDRNIIRIAVFEMKFSTELLPPSVAINEAVELAKEYGTENSAKFINGILGSVAKQAQTE